jgi:glycosyltransferase involved in cell wall biosynthesis
MKIAILTPTFFPYSCIDRVVEEEAENLGKKHDVTIFTFRASMKPKNAKLEILGMPKNPLLERVYRLFFILGFCKIRKYLKKLQGFDKIISHQYPMNILASKAKKRYNIHYTYYDAGIADPELFTTLGEKLYMRLFIWFNKLSLRNADDAISISNYLKDELKKSAGLNAKVEYVKIDTKRFNKDVPKQTATKKRVEELKNKYSIKGPVCIYVGRISPHKGIHLLIESFNKVQKKIPNAKLLIIGKETFDSYSKVLKKISNNNIIFTGFVNDSDLPYYYALCDVYTTATLWEGFNMPVVEAQAMGKKVVAFNLCSHPEVVKNGILVKPRDTYEFANAILKILKN